MQGRGEETESTFLMYAFNKEHQGQLGASGGTMLAKMDGLELYGN